MKRKQVGGSGSPDMKRKQVGGSGSAAGSSAPQQSPESEFLGKVLDNCQRIVEMLRINRNNLSAILYRGWPPEQVPLEDEELDGLLLESEAAMERMISSVQAEKPEEMTEQRRAALAAEMGGIQDSAVKQQKELIDLTEELADAEPEAARNRIRYRLDMKRKHVGGSGSATGAAGSSAPQQIPESEFLGKVLDNCQRIVDMLRINRNNLSAILYRGWPPEQVPLEDEELDGLLLESEAAVERMISSVRAAKPEEMTGQRRAALAAEMGGIQDSAVKQQKELIDLTEELADAEPEAARNRIRHLLDTRPQQVGSSGSATGGAAAGGSSAPRQSQESGFTDILNYCQSVRDMLRDARNSLMAVLYRGRAPEKVPLGDKDVDALLLESETAMDKAIASAANPEKVTEQGMDAIGAKMNNLQNLAIQVDIKVKGMMDKLAHAGPQEARTYIRYMLATWRRT